jgi:hypothetical protein
MLGACCRAGPGVCAVEMRRPATAAGRNCCSKRGRRGGVLGGSYECVMLSDTANNCSRAGERVERRFCPPGNGTLTEVHFGGPSANLRMAEPHDRCSTHPTTPQRHTNHRKHGRPIRGSTAIRDHDRRMRNTSIGRLRLLTAPADVRIQRRLGREAQGDTERRQEGQARCRPVGQGEFCSTACSDSTDDHSKVRLLHDDLIPILNAAQ